MSRRWAISGHSTPWAARWTELPSPPPQPRQLYALATLGGAAYFFGGGDIDGGYRSDLWRLDVASFEWSELSPAGAVPAARSGATMVADAVRSRMLLFGGKDASGEFGDLWQLGGS